MEPSSSNQPPTLGSAVELHHILWTNLLTLLGLLLVGSGLVLLITFWLFTIISPEQAQNRYLNILGYMILPGILVTGLVLCPVGIWVRKWRLRRGPIREIPTRYAFLFLAVTFFLILPVLGVSGYRGYHYTESSQFCGSCHSVMDPQYARYQVSPHARVTCAGCHIGPGASPFVKSKLSGLRQVFKTALGTFPRPIPPAISELRPARETCEECHWPEQFFGSQLKTIVRYTPDEKNTRHDYEIRIKVGGADQSLGRFEGIHMHMLDRVEYIATDNRLDHIPWVRYTYPDGSKIVFRSDGKKQGEPPPEGDLRKMDCIDCHNLSGHGFMSPQRAVDNALDVKHLDDSLPFLKREAVKALVKKYATTDQAMSGIAKDLGDFYRTTYPDVWRQRREAVDGAIKAVQTIYRGNIFPEMKVNWQTYPDHIGHMESPGCFRCHDGLHVSTGGREITEDCMSCHTFLNPVPGTSMVEEGSFIHQMKINDLWEGLGPHERMLCTDCHDGGLKAWGWSEELASTACGDCHSSGRWLEMRRRVEGREVAASVPAGVGTSQSTDTSAK